MKVVRSNKSGGVRFGDLDSGATFVMDDVAHDSNVRIKIDSLLDNKGTKEFTRIMYGRLAVNLRNGVLVEIDPDTRVFPKNVIAIEKNIDV